MSFSFFVDPILRGPVIGSMLMSLAASLVGVIVFLKKRSLLGEALSHAAYPGVVIAGLMAAIISPYSEEIFSIFILCGALVTSLIGLKAIDFLKRRLRLADDAALCLVLSSFFGAALLIASSIQTSYATWYRKAQSFLYGQAATMTDIHIWVYGILSCLIVLCIVVSFRHLEATSFDREFSKTIGISIEKLDSLFFILIALAIVVGMRTVGVVLIAGMLIAPATAARPLTKKLSHHFIFAGIIGALSGFLGSVGSIKLSSAKMPLPTGPMVLLAASSFCVLSLLFSPQMGLIPRYFRAVVFRHTCALENALKAFWHGRSPHCSWLILLILRYKKWIDSTKALTAAGHKQAEKIIRLHRLWEVYLVDYMGQQEDKVHRNAEELEHLLTPELEEQLTTLLKDPKHDPHQQPIPPLRS